MVVTHGINQICYWTWLIIYLLYILSMIVWYFFLIHIILAYSDVIIRCRMVVILSLYDIDNF